MSDELSIFFIVILAVGGASLMTLLLSCYACILRDLCCKQGKKLKKRSVAKKRIPGSQNNDTFNQFDTIIMNDITQIESIPTESEKV